jgi:hypothetical protein
MIIMTRHETIEAINKRLKRMDTKKLKKVLESIDKAVPLTGDAETDWWLESHPDVLERVKQHKAGKTKSRPLKEIMKELGDKA